MPDQICEQAMQEVLRITERGQKGERLFLSVAQKSSVYVADSVELTLIHGRPVSCANLLQSNA